MACSKPRAPSPSPSPGPTSHPVAVDDVATTTQETPVAIDVLGNDTDADGDTLTIVSAQQWIARAGELHLGLVHLHARARLLRHRLVHVHHRRRLRWRRRRHRDGHRQPVTDRRQPRARDTDDRPGRDVDQPRRHPLRADAGTRCRRVELARSLDASPFDATRRPSLRRSPFITALTAVRVRAVRAPLAVWRTGAPLSEIPVDFPGGWPALLAGTDLAGAPTQSITFGQFLALYDPPDHRRPALRDLTLADLSFFDGTPLADATPGCLPARRDALVESLQFGTQTGAIGLRPTPSARRRAPRSAVGPQHDARSSSTSTPTLPRSSLHIPTFAGSRWRPTSPAFVGAPAPRRQV